jgi:hypothetical protein
MGSYFPRTVRWKPEGGDSRKKGVGRKEEGPGAERGSGAEVAALGEWPASVLCCLFSNLFCDLQFSGAPQLKASDTLAPLS